MIQVPISKAQVEASCHNHAGASGALLEDDGKYLERAFCHTPQWDKNFGEPGAFYTLPEPAPEVPLDFSKAKRASNSRYWRMTR